MAVVDVGHDQRGAPPLEPVRTNLVEVAAELDACSMTPAEAAAVFGQLAGLLRLTQGLLLSVAARAGEWEGWREDGERSVVGWMARQLGSSRAEAQRTLDTSEQLAACSGTQRALRDGRLSAGQAHEVVAGAAADAESEADLLASANTDQLHGLRQRSLRVRAAAATDPEGRWQRIHDARFARRHRHHDGSESVELRDNPDAIAEVWAAIEPLADEQFRRAHRAGRREAAEAHRADAFVELASRVSGGVSGRPVRSRKPKFILLASLDTVVRGHLHRGELCEIPGVGPYPVHRAREQLGEAVVHLVVSHGTDLSTVVTNSRYVAPAVQTALEAAHPECSVEGCNATWGLENDHLASATGFADTGVTHFAGLDRKCRGDHRDRTLGRGRFRRPGPPG